VRPGVSGRWSLRPFAFRGPSPAGPLGSTPWWASRVPIDGPHCRACADGTRVSTGTRGNRPKGRGRSLEAALRALLSSSAGAVSSEPRAPVRPSWSRRGGTWWVRVLALRREERSANRDPHDPRPYGLSCGYESPRTSRALRVSPRSAFLLIDNRGQSLTAQTVRLVSRVACAMRR
jgi:hypothetical protein